MANEGGAVSTNINQVLKDLATFRRDLGTKTVRASIRRITVEAQRQLDAAVPVRTGKLRSNVRVTVKYVPERKVITGRVLINKRGKATDTKNAFYWYFVEKGHRIATSKTGRLARRPGAKGGQSIGMVAGRWFVRNTWGRLQGVIVSMFYNDLQRAVDKAGKRYL